MCCSQWSTWKAAAIGTGTGAVFGGVKLLLILTITVWTAPLGPNNATDVRIRDHTIEGLNF